MATSVRAQEERLQTGELGPGASHVRWVVLLLLCLMYLITYLDRVSLANTAPMIIKEFGFSKATMRVMFSAFI